MKKPLVLLLAGLFTLPVFAAESVPTPAPCPVEAEGVEAPLPADLFLPEPQRRISCDGLQDTPCGSYGFVLYCTNVWGQDDMCICQNQCWGGVCWACGPI